MNISKILIDVFKILLHKSIEENGIDSLKTLSISQKLDKLILDIQINNYNRYKTQFNY